MRAMGIDFGLARIGIAFSDETKFLASPYETYKRKSFFFLTSEKLTSCFGAKIVISYNKLLK